MDKLTPFSRTRYKNDWKPQEAELLLDNMKNKQAFRVYLPQCSIPVYSTLLGFDLCKGELLLDTFQACSIYDIYALVQQQSQVTLSLKLNQGVYLVHCVFNQVDVSGKHYLVSLNVLDTQTSVSKRLNPRIYFANTQGPQALITASLNERLGGELLDLSVFGCQIRIPGKDIRNKFNSRLARVNLRFNEEFQFDCESEIKQCHFLRQPYCHNKMRLMFSQQSALQYEQLKTFIDTLDCANALNTINDEFAA